MNCGDKINYSCGEKLYATCVYYELDLPEFSEIEGECTTIEETTEDQYKLLEDIFDQIDLSDLGETCLDYIQGEDNKNIVKNVLKKFEEEICSLKDRVEVLESTDICDKSIEECGLDLGTLVDECDNPLTTLKDVLQVLLNQHNS